MKLRRTLRFHGTKRGRVRQTWNKYNLFNLYRLNSNQNIRPTERTFFQQKWAAKAITRGYHGEHIKERQWERMFTRRLLSVVEMDARYMARHDGSEQAAGRGSGRDIAPSNQWSLEPGKTTQLATKSRGRTPYMQMAFAPMERRLDIAVFRALFASSARQARQFVVHGAVKVNGKKMVYPGYLLNPGDMFQVDVDRVLFATGRKKAKSIAAPKKSSDEGEDVAEEPAEAEESTEDAAAAESTTEPAEEFPDGEEAAKKEKEELKALRDRVKTILADPSRDLTGKQKKALRGLAQDVRSAMSRLGQRKPAAATDAGTADVEAPSSSSDSVVDNLATLLSNLEVSSAARESGAADATAGADVGGREKDGGAPLTAAERERLNRLLTLEAENPYDPDKPYQTPWRPRPYMSPFAFIPRYLEVNQNICAAVYIRHPVSRVGMAEVPTPFPHDTSQLAFNWYLRRR